MKTPLLSKVLIHLAERHTAARTRRHLDTLSDTTRRDIGLPPLGPAPRNPFTERW